MKDGINLNSISYFIMLAIVGYIAVYAIFSMSGAAEPNYEKEQQMAQNAKSAIDRALVQCYALEGSYPADLDYIEHRYGIQLDKERFFYYFEVFGSNIMPDVIVIPLKADAPDESVES